MSKINNQNNFYGNTNFNGQVNFFKNVVINKNADNKDKANYTPEPRWRSPLTLAVLSWISVFLGLLSLTSVWKIIIGTLRGLLKWNISTTLNFEKHWYFVLLPSMMLFVIAILLLNITKKQIRIPLFLNYAVNGYGKRITIEKIHTGKCPVCGGKMKYRFKPSEWNEIQCNNGTVKRQVTKRITVLECMRNNKHSFEVDPAEHIVE